MTRPRRRHDEDLLRRASRSAGSWARSSSARTPTSQRAVLNVPGADLVADVRRLDVLQRRSSTRSSRASTSTRDSFEGRRFLTVAQLVHGRGRSAAPRPDHRRARAADPDGDARLHHPERQHQGPRAGHRRAAPRLRRRARLPHHSRRARVLPRYARPRERSSPGSSSHEDDRRIAPRSPAPAPTPVAPPSANRTRSPPAPAAPAPRATTIRAPRGTTRPRSPTAAACASASRSRSRTRRSQARSADGSWTDDSDNAWATPPHIDASFAQGKWAAGIALGVPFGGGVTWPRRGPARPRP